MTSDVQTTTDATPPWPPALRVAILTAATMALSVGLAVPAMRPFTGVAAAALAMTLPMIIFSIVHIGVRRWFADWRTTRSRHMCGSCFQPLVDERRHDICPECGFGLTLPRTHPRVWRMMWSGVLGLLVLVPCTTLVMIEATARGVTPRCIAAGSVVVLVATGWRAAANVCVLTDDSAD